MLPLLWIGAALLGVGAVAAAASGSEETYESDNEDELREQERQRKINNAERDIKGYKTKCINNLKKQYSVDINFKDTHKSVNNFPFYGLGGFTGAISAKTDPKSEADSQLFTITDNKKRRTRKQTTRT